MTDDPLPIFDGGICPDCLTRQHSRTCWRCAECQARHDAEIEARRAPRPIELP